MTLNYLISSNNSRLTQSDDQSNVKIYVQVVRSGRFKMWSN